MPVVKVYRHGLTAACVPDGVVSSPPERTKCQGWTAHTLRRNRDFLYSVDERGLSGSGFACTFTVAECPPTHEDWKRVREALFVRYRRMGLIRAHWLTEWQRRGVPHLHGAFWFPDALVRSWGNFGDNLACHWLSLANAPYGAQLRAQNAQPIWDAVGWNQYVSKHAARGLSHYQRNPASIPAGWRGVGTGRMWGTLGEWPRVAPSLVQLPMGAFHIFRRIVRGYRLADARRALASRSSDYRAKVARRRISSARGALTCPDPKLSAVRGLAEWLPQDDQLRVLELLASQGHDIQA